MYKPLISSEMMVQSRGYNRGVRYERIFFLIFVVMICARRTLRLITSFVRLYFYHKLY